MSTLSRYQKLPVNNAARVEKRIETLREQNRLAMHCFEFNDCGKLYPDEVMKDIKANDQAPLPILLCEEKKAALFSLSLLPRAGKSITPYSDGIAYLFDMSAAEKEAPPLVVMASPVTINSGMGRFDKDLKCGYSTGIDGLDALYHGHNDASFKRAVANDPALSEKQLDVLGACYDLPTACQKSLFNEIVAAVRKDHIAAIAIPYDPLEGDNKPFTELKGALAGLAHLQHGMNLPVMLYNVSDRDPECKNAGKSTYVAQGREECVRVAVDAIRRLQIPSVIKTTYLDDVRSECKTLLGIDVDTPVDAQLSRRRI